jgi:hypothetical protein
MKNKLTQICFWFYVLPLTVRADFLDRVGESVFDDPDDDAGLLDALLNVTAWATAIFTFLGVLFLFGAWFELKKKDTGSVVYTLAAVGGLFLTPLIIKTLRAIADI